MAMDAGLDLVEVSPNERPPVCKILDYGKSKYLKSKLKQKHHERKLKEVRIRPKTDDHDKMIKLNRARKFLEGGDRVQFTMIFRGRERVHRDIGYANFNEIAKMMEDVAKLDRPAKSLGRRMTMVLAPLKLPPPPPQKRLRKKKPDDQEPQVEASDKASPPEADKPAEVLPDIASAPQTSVPPASPSVTSTADGSV